MSSREQPIRLPGDNYILRGEVVVLLEGFRAVCIANTVSRAGLNGMRAIERGRANGEAGEPSADS